ncbi:MAG TPA: hypothetical protein VLV54_20145 [Thermoanaerobaculia bacterium]|nr:hypothetical protein [Thermoanaerobaculia bacterium]
METGDMDRVHFITQHFKDLQGLRYGAPLGLITLGLGGSILLRVAFFLAAVVLVFGARRFYQRFGEVESRPVDYAAEISVFSPAGATPQLEGFRQVRPIMRHLFITLTLVMILFSIFQAFPRTFQVEGQPSPGQRPRISFQKGLERPWIVGSQPQPSGMFQPPWVAWVYAKVPARPPSMLRAVFAQMMYALYGSLFLGLWLWRGHRLSQSHHLVCATLLLGLSGLGTSLGYVARPDGEIARILDFLLPALVYPGVALLLCGSAMVLTSLFDHWQLVSAFGPMAPTEED